MYPSLNSDNNNVECYTTGSLVPSAPPINNTTATVPTNGNNAHTNNDNISTTSYPSLTSSGNALPTAPFIQHNLISSTSSPVINNNSTVNSNFNTINTNDGNINYSNGNNNNSGNLYPSLRSSCSPPTSPQMQPIHNTINNNTNVNTMNNNINSTAMNNNMNSNTVSNDAYFAVPNSTECNNGNNNNGSSNNNNTNSSVNETSKLILYNPISVATIPPQLPACTEKLPQEKREEAERKRREEKQKKLASKASNKLFRKNKGPMGIINTLGDALSEVASTAIEGLSTIHDDLHYSQSNLAEERFRSTFPQFITERLLAEYTCKMICSPVDVLFGRFYISSKFFYFYANQYNKIMLIMLPLANIASIQFGVQSQSAAPIQPNTNAIPAPQFEVNTNPAAKSTALLIYTSDLKVHVFFGFKYLQEAYNVLDHAWRDPSPTLLTTEEQIQLVTGLQQHRKSQNKPPIAFPPIPNSPTHPVI